ncbi:exosome complex component RRP40 [Adelges cooleyi]|uniref:exosome complex component RRP40 n=1 Tax=Adelges cooleyi TaxID=133065 RepID=UPI00217FF875|nr:exosome complex component RRP40 [Adelges cooleyi]
MLDSVVLPGNDVSQTIFEGESKKQDKIIGPGLVTNNGKIIVSNGGILRGKHNKLYWVEHRKKKYMPSKDDIVVGVVVAKTSELYKVDIGSHEFATLPYLAFTNATKKNRPDVKVGNVLAARVKATTPYMEAEISCVESANSVVLGLLEDGFLISVSLNYALQLKNPNSKLLSELGHFIPYEIVIGINGKVWIKTSSVQRTIAIGSAIINAEHLKEDDIPQLIKTLKM